VRSSKLRARRGATVGRFARPCRSLLDFLELGVDHVVRVGLGLGTRLAGAPPAAACAACWSAYIFSPSFWLAVIRASVLASMAPCRRP
jgi:hypothetical protein